MFYKRIKNKPSFKEHMLEMFLSLTAGILLFVATITDWRTREVPDWINYTGITIGIGVRSIWTVNAGDWTVFGAGISGLLLMYLIGALMYYTGQWGGGDSKAGMAIGAIVGFWPFEFWQIGSW